ncbi:MAG: hypothetical protein ABL958_14120 [Bdellovibrionia bacterium]
MRKLFQTIKNRRGVGTLVPVMGVGVMIAVSFVLAQQYFLARTNNYRRDLQSNKLLSVMENLSRNIIHNGFETANKAAYEIAAAGGCRSDVGALFNNCCAGVGPLAGALHLRKGATGYFGCWPNRDRNGILGFCPQIGGVDQPVYRFGNATAGGDNNDGTWGCFGLASAAPPVNGTQVCIQDPNAPAGNYFCALLNQSSILAAKNEYHPNKWETMVAWGYDLMDRHLGKILLNADVPVLFETANAMPARALAPTGNSNQYPPPPANALWTLNTLGSHPSMLNPGDRLPNAAGRHLMQRCLLPEQCSEFWFCTAPLDGAPAAVAPGANSGNGRCFRQPLQLAANLQVPGRTTPLGAALTGAQLCSLADQPRTTDPSAEAITTSGADDSFVCVKTLNGGGTCNDPVGVGNGQFAFCTKVCRDEYGGAVACANVGI